MNEEKVIDTVVYKTMVAADITAIKVYDTIEYEGDFWLVTEWLESPGVEWKSPKRMIRVTGMLQSGVASDYQVDFLLTGPIEQSVFDGEEDSNLKILEEPGYKFLIQRQH